MSKERSPYREDRRARNPRDRQALEIYFISFKKCSHAHFEVVLFLAREHARRHCQVAITHAACRREVARRISIRTIFARPLISIPSSNSNNNKRESKSRPTVLDSILSPSRPPSDSFYTPRPPSAPVLPIIVV